ncbi:MAG: hypothetical protein COT71_02295 [Candidatus Andersenbacteria bacterium CG10_big_fil_rev_8_21_14_0_10_54_11]|uniref:HTH cro/C1-type domain-containing protein n=1 Tax=Candidatus Andersenbacteria bacterium CG10_big_fil_rev_8_21_14_0_10_54_11 TaxID=1974485 RepID=A0A2M6WZE1_9BACT|nr:MAG: hypothetical protein COT71_02295 [Candidatus Andersenbacteria bacterium CG10_big_fil_rev_8_21_14_0_10_54_11]
MVGTRTGGGSSAAAVGAQLRQAREALGSAVDEVAAEIRVPPQQLLSLEEGNLSVFPADVYARGAYLNYARYLGVDRQDTYRAFLRSLSFSREQVPLTVPTPARWLSRVLTPYGVFLLLLAGAVGAVGSYLGWQVFSFVRLPALTVTAPAAALAEGSLVTVAGKTEAGVTVQINGEYVPVDRTAHFSYQLWLRQGVNTIQVEAIGASGRSRVITRNVLVPRALAG